MTTSWSGALPKNRATRSRKSEMRLVRRDNLGVPLEEQRQGTPRRADVHRLPEAVEHQDLTV